MEAVVTSVADALKLDVADGFQLEPPVSCAEPYETEDPLRSAGAGVELALGESEVAAVLQRAATQLEAEGASNVETLEPDSDLPRVDGNLDDYVLAVDVNVQSGRVFVGGSTPCLPQEF